MRGVTRRELRAMLRAAGRRAVPESERLGVPATPPLQMFVEAPASRHEVRAMLGAAGTRPVPPLSPAFVALADPVGQSLPPALTVDPRPGAERRSRRPALLIGAAAAVLTVMLVAALTGVVGGPEAEAELALGAAVDTVVVLPDGSTVDGTRGLALPDGSIVRTGPHGRAVAGGVELGPGAEAVVDDGHLVPTRTREAGPAGAVTPPSSATSGAPAADSATAAVEGAVPAAPSGGDGGAAGGSAPATDVPPPAVTLPAVTVPTLPKPPSGGGGLPGVVPIR